MFEREIAKTLKKTANSFPVVVVTGPRQSGKTTLLKHEFPKYEYLNLEFPDVREHIESDPREIIERYQNQGIIFDEAQRYPDLFSYIQGYVDEAPKPGRFILSGSQNILLQSKVSQTLAGRSVWLELLPLTHSELLTHKSIKQPDDVWEWLYDGAYPRPYQENIDIKTWYQAYLRTYLERDVRDLLNIKDLSQFQNFIKLCAGRHGQILNTSELARDAGVSHTTINSWLSILESSYIIFLLKPYYKNFSKRVIKSPKLYFYDSAIVSQLLGIDSAEHLSLHSSRGAIFEGYIISSFIKHSKNKGEIPAIYYWRDTNGNEIDCLIEKGEKLFAFEIKSTQTLRQDIFRSLQKWAEITNNPVKQNKLIYTGHKSQQWKNINAVSWKNIDDIF